MGEIGEFTSQIVPEQNPVGFSIEGDGGKFSLDEGEILDSRGEYPGFINFVGEGGKPERFEGGIYDRGDHWQVLRFDAVGGEYLIPKAGGVPEAKQAAPEGLAAAGAEVPVGGLADAAAAVAMEAGASEPPAPAAEPQPQQEPAPPAAVAPAAEAVEQPAEEVMAPAEAAAPAGVKEPQPVSEPSPAPMSEPAPELETVAVPVEAGRRVTVAEARQQFDREFKDMDARARRARYDAEQKNSLQQRAQELRAEADRARKSINRLKKTERISAAISEEGKRIAEAKKLEEQAAAIPALEQDQIRAIEDRRQRALELTQEIGRWENLMENPALIEEHRGLDGRMQEDLAAVEKLFGGGNPEDQAVLDVARKRIEGRTQTRRTELQGMFPRRYMELAGMAPRQDLPEAGIDFTTLDRDLIERYYQFADQFYAELTGQPQAVQPETPPAPVSEQVLPAEPVIQQVVETVAEGEAEPPVVEQPAEVTMPPVTEEAAAPEPVEAPVGAAGAPAAEAPAAPAELPVQLEPELTPDQIRERAERRRNNFADAVANLEGAYMDTSGTQAERVGRVVERVRGMILAGLELAEEGAAAQEAVMNVLGRLNNEQNRRLVGAAVGQAPEQVEQAVGNMLRARGAFGPDGKPKSRKELEEAGLVGLIELLLQLGMSFTDASISAVIGEVQSATGAGR